MKLKNFKDIALKYKAIFFDSYGVLKNYNGLIDGVNETTAWLDENKMDWYVLTNDASRSPQLLAKKLDEAGMDAIIPEKLITSGMMARHYLRLKIKNGTVAYLGTENSAHYIEDAGLETIPVSDIDFNDLDSVKALVLLDDEGFDWNTDISKSVNLLRKKNIPVVVANTDTRYPVGKGEVAVAIGGVGNMIESIVKKRFIRFGKPDSQIFFYAFDLLNEKHKVKKSEILMVGDTLTTDILGGNKFGLDTCLVLTGNTLKERAKTVIKSYGIIPTYICESIGVSSNK